MVELIVGLVAFEGKGSLPMDNITRQVCLKSIDNGEVGSNVTTENTFQDLIDEFNAQDWNKIGPDDVIRALDQALQLELPELAIKIAQMGSKLFPDHDRIQQAGRILAPPVIRISKTSSVRNLEPSRNWLRSHATDYRGQWVAVRNGTLLGAAPSMKELLEKVGTEIDRTNTIITKVL